MLILAAARCFDIMRQMGKTHGAKTQYTFIINSTLIYILLVDNNYNNGYLMKHNPIRIKIIQRQNVLATPIKSFKCHTRTLLFTFYFFFIFYYSSPH